MVTQSFYKILKRGRERKGQEEERRVVEKA